MADNLDIKAKKLTDVPASWSYTMIYIINNSMQCDP